jgi:Rab guanine nucleotide exchange factor SEC2
MAAVANAPGIPTTPPLPTGYNDGDESMSTIPDPRSRTRSPTNAGGSPEGFTHHPDLSNEVATLSNKLINAINHQTNLDDTLSATRHELEASRERIRQLELEAEEYGDQIFRGLLIRSTVVQAERKKLLASVAEEKIQRAKVEKEKKRIELELENLTTALFEEANKVWVEDRLIYFNI